MNKRIVLFSITIIIFFIVKADAPGKAEMHESRVSFQGIKNIPGYTFYWTLENVANAGAVIADTSFYMASSHGAPYSYSFWGVNIVTKKSTDTLHFRNYYAPDYVIILTAVQHDSIQFNQKELSNANEILNEGNTDSIANKQLVADAKAAKRKHYTKISLFIGAGIIALGGLIWFFVRRRKKKQLEQDLKG